MNNVNFAESEKQLKSKDSNKGNKQNESKMQKDIQNWKGSSMQAAKYIVSLKVCAKERKAWKSNAIRGEELQKNWNGVWYSDTTFIWSL